MSNTKENIMLDDYIKRSDALFELYRYASAKDPALMIAYRVDLCERIEAIPAADVKHVRHGRWEYDSDHIPHCSECGTIALQRHKLYLEEKIYDVPFVLSKRCPECGAKMGVEDDGTL